MAGPFVCENCDLQLACKQNLQKHIESGVCKKPDPKCPKCGKTFGRPCRYRDHIAKCTHGDPPVASNTSSDSVATAVDSPSQKYHALDFNKTSVEAVLAYIADNPDSQDSLREAFEHGCVHEELTRLTHFAGPAENRNVHGIDNKGPFMKVVNKGESVVMNANMGVQMIINRNIKLGDDPVIKAVLGLEESEPVLEVAVTTRQKAYEALQIRAVITNSGNYVIPTRECVQSVVTKTSRVAWSVRTRNCVAAQQGWQCNICDDLLTDCYDIDHKVPLFKGGADAYSNLQALCVPCHRNKSAAERSKGVVLLPNCKDTASTSTYVD